MKASLATLPAKASEPNEDFAGLTPSAAVLLDGSGLSGTETLCRHGVAWYARTLGTTLLKAVSDNDSEDLRDILARSIFETAEAHRDTCNLDDPGTPSATVLIARVGQVAVDYLVLADSVFLVDRVTGEPLVITDDREAQIGERYRGHMDSLRNGTAAHDEARREYVQALRSHRNQPDGFWVAAADPKAAEQAITGAVPLGDVNAVALLSDGASRLVDRFNLSSWADLTASMRLGGPDELIRRVRAAEESDRTGSRWPRGKAHDDATAIWLAAH